MLPSGRAALIAGCLLLLTLPPPQVASAQVRRCTAANGAPIYTDRKCTDIGATERLPGAPSAGNTGG